MTDAHTACSPSHVADALREAEALSEARGQRLTPIRRQVLKLLLDSAQPVKAYDLLERLEGHGAQKPPTVYRALDFLREMRFAHKIESLNAYVACGHMRHAHAAVFLICERCNSVTELHAEELRNELVRTAQSVGFKLASAMIEAQGTCKVCMEAQL